MHPILAVPYRRSRLGCVQASEQGLKDIRRCPPGLADQIGQAIAINSAIEPNKPAIQDAYLSALSLLIFLSRLFSLPSWHAIDILAKSSPDL